MAVGVKVGSIVDEIGAPSFLNAFFSTIAALLENGSPGSRFPVVSNDLYQGHLDAHQVEQSLVALRTIRDELAKYPPTAVVWDLEDRSKQPPWKQRISPEITSMANYFVTSTGRDLFEVLFEALSDAQEERRPVDIVEY